MIGRKSESGRIQGLLQSTKSEFLAITGRRRVGKTFLIDTQLSQHYCFNMTGIQNGSLREQLINFSVKLAEYDGSNTPKLTTNWQTAFLYLKTYLKTLDKGQKQVIFIDELPWVDTAKSGFVQMLAHFWNDYLSKEPHFLLVVCGSASSWIVKKVLNDAGGLHNRVTENIHLRPFTLTETADFLKTKGIMPVPEELARIYMVLGGIPFYLDRIQRGEGFSTAIERLCFEPTGLLYREYDNLFQALFKNSALHQQIVSILANKHYGLSSQDIIAAIGLERATGSYQRALEELVVSDFVVESTPFGRQKRGAMYRLVDEFSIFYHHFMRNNRKYSPGIWQQLAETQSYKTWSGYSFENLCFQHIEQIKRALGISAVYTEVSSLRIPADGDEPGFQIDLLIDRRDNCINLCEIKFHSTPFALQRADYQRLAALKQRFVAQTGTRKQVFITFISNQSIVKNDFAAQIVDNEIILTDLL
jgi:uncharacterized protein